MVLVHEWQLWRQRCALGLLAGVDVGFRCKRQTLKFLLDGRDVRINGLVEQAGLDRIELLAAAAKLAKRFNTAISCVS